jgi:hypothetical protein
VVPEFILLFQLLAVGGTEVLVVVCVPLDQTHFMVSPMCAVKVEGVKEKSATVTVCTVADELIARQIMALSRSKVFFMVIVFCCCNRAKKHSCQHNKLMMDLPGSYR